MKHCESIQPVTLIPLSVPPFISCKEILTKNNKSLKTKGPPINIGQISFNEKNEAQSKLHGKVFSRWCFNNTVVLVFYNPCLHKCNVITKQTKYEC